MTLFLGFAVAYAVLGRRLRPPLLRACGFAPASHRFPRAPSAAQPWMRMVRAYAIGFLSGVLPLVAMIGILILLGAHAFEVRRSAGDLTLYFAKAVALGLLLVVLEEGLFRGLLLGDFIRAIGVRAGVIVCSLCFAVVHFFGVTDTWRGRPEPVRSGPDVVLALFEGMGRMFTEWPELVGLFLVGVILSILRLRAGTLYLAMGVHAGWYCVRQMDRHFVNEVDAVVKPNQLWLGSEQYLDGVLGWAALVLTLFFALRTSRIVADGPG